MKPVSHRLTKPEQKELTAIIDEKIKNWEEKLEFDFFIKNGRLIDNYYEDFSEKEQIKHDKELSKILGFKI